MQYVLRIGLAALLLVATVQSSYARAYHVTTEGSGNPDGSLEHPYSSIQDAVSLLEPGDTCYIHPGTYYQGFRVSTSGTQDNPIVITGYGSEPAVIHGGEKLSGWSHVRGNIYKTSYHYAARALFAGRTNMLKARHPNMEYDPESGFDMLNPRTGTSNPPDSVAWDGVSYMHLSNYGWVYRIRRINSHVDDRDGILIGVKGLLDSEGEWIQVGSELFFNSPGGLHPDSMLVETKSRPYGVSATGLKNITFSNLTVFGTTINLDGAEYCIIEDCKVFYHGSMFHTSGRKGGWHRDQGNSFAVPGKGIVVGGQYNQVRHCEIAHTWGDGITIYGNNNTVYDCHIYDCNWSGTDCAAVGMSGRDHLVSRNTMHDCGRSVVVHRKTESSKITYNHLYRSGHMVYDLGLTYTFATDGKGTEIAYNWVHNDLSSNEGGRGIYVDMGSRNHLIHHNVIWNIATGGKSGAFSCGDDNAHVYNNTIYNTRRIGCGSLQNRCGGCRIMNNIFNNEFGYDKIVGRVESNFFMGNAGLQAPNAKDWRLRSSSICIDAGKVIPGVTDDYTGDAPDLGAYEYGVDPWEPGVGTGPEYAVKPALTPERRRCSPCEVAITTQTPNAMLRYTTDGTEVTAQSPSYSEPFEVAPGTRVRARAFKNGLRPSREVTAVFRGHRDPFDLIPAETAEAFSGIHLDSLETGRKTLTSVDSLDWVQFESIDFASSPRYFEAAVGNPFVRDGDKFEVRLDSINGPVISVITPERTRSFWEEHVVRAPCSTVTGIHDIYLVAYGELTAGYLHWVRFSNADAISHQIAARIGRTGEVRLAVYDAAGRRVHVEKGVQLHGIAHNLRSFRRKVGAGVYILRIFHNGECIDTRRMVTGGGREFKLNGNRPVSR